MNKEPRFLYLRNEKKTPIACLALQIDDEQKQVKYAFSVRNPVENIFGGGFDREHARSLAAGRLLLNPTILHLYKSDLDIHEITGYVLETMLMIDRIEHNLPGRVKKSIKNWLNFKTEKKEEAVNE